MERDLRTGLSVLLPTLKHQEDEERQHRRKENSQ